MNSQSSISVGQEVWFCPSYEGSNSLGCFLVKCKVTKIYFLDSNRTENIGGIPCSTLVSINSDKDDLPSNCEGCIIFYELDEPVGHDVNRDFIFTLEEFDRDGIEGWLDCERTELINSNKVSSWPDLYKWRENKIEFLKKNGCPELKSSDYPVKNKNTDWFVPDLWDI